MGYLAEQLKRSAKPMQREVGYGAHAVNQYPHLSPVAEHSPALAKQNAVRLHRFIMRANGCRIRESIGDENFEHLKARDFMIRVEDDRGLGAVQFRIAKNSRKITHMEVHLQPSGDYLVRALRFRKVPGVFEWVFEGEAERVISFNTQEADYPDAFAYAFSMLTGFDMGQIRPYAFKLEDPTMTCPMCKLMFGPRAKAHSVRGKDAIYCSRPCAEKAIP